MRDGSNDCDDDDDNALSANSFCLFILSLGLLQETLLGFLNFVKAAKISCQQASEARAHANNMARRGDTQARPSTSIIPRA